MTDANGSATAEKPDAGIPDPSKGGGDQGSNANASDPLAGLVDPGIREWAGKAGFKDTTASSFEALAKKTRDAESLIGRSVQVPGDNAKAEDWDKFYAKVGRPEKPDGYAFKLPEGLPEGMPYDETFAGKFKSWAHANGLTTKQAASLHDNWVKDFGSNFQAQGEAWAGKVTAATAALEKEYGGALDSEPFKKGIEITSRAITESGGEDLMNALKDAGLIDKTSGHVLNPSIAIAFHKIGKQLFSEDNLERGDGDAVVDNPFKDGPDKGNLTEQMIMVKKNRPEAERLMRMAGYTPEQFGLNPPA